MNKGEGEENEKKSVAEVAQRMNNKLNPSEYNGGLQKLSSSSLPPLESVQNDRLYEVKYSCPVENEHT